MIYKSGDPISITLRFDISGGPADRMTIAYRNPATDRTVPGAPVLPGPRVYAFNLNLTHAESDGSKTFTGVIPSGIVGATYLAVLYVDGPGGRDFHELGSEYNIVIADDPVQPIQPPHINFT